MKNILKQVFLQFKILIIKDKWEINPEFIVYSNYILIIPDLDKTGIKKAICQIFIKQSQDADFILPTCNEYNECTGFCKSKFTVVNLSLDT